MIEEFLNTHNFRCHADIPRKVRLEFGSHLVGEKL